MKIKNLKLKIIFLGSSKFVIPILEVLQENFDLKLVLTTEKNPSDAVPDYCIKNKIPYFSASSLSDPTFNSQLSTFNSPVAVLADFGLLVPKDVLNAFPKGILNIHPSLLPKYRGPTPVQTAILNGDKTTGVSIMKLDEEIDHGPILAQQKEEILDKDTSETLYKRLFEKGANLLLKVLSEYLNENQKPIPQNHKQATFTKPLTRQDGYIEMPFLTSHFSPLILKRMIRAYFPWPGVFTKLKINGKELRVKLLPENKIQVEGKKPTSYKDFLNGYPDAKSVILPILK